MKIDQLETPFLYLDQDGEDEVAIHPAYLKSHVPMALAQQTGAPRPHKMQAQELQEALSLVETDADGFANFLTPKWTHTGDFGDRRQVRTRSVAARSSTWAPAL